MGWAKSVGTRCLGACVIALISIALVSCGATNVGGPPPPPSPGDLKSLNHIIFLIQENRSFDSIFGQLVTFRTMQGLPAGGIDGLPPDGTPACPNPGIPPMANGSPSCMPTNLKNNSFTDVQAAFHLNTMCIENTSNSWGESHRDFSLFNDTSNTPAMDGFAWSAGGDAVFDNFLDTAGIRAMGYYNWNDMPYHYFLATQFATSDRWFSPCPCETEPNKLYALAATSAGHAHKPSGAFNIPTIFSLLESANISWKVYFAGDRSEAIINFFQPFASQHADKIQPIANYFSDLQSGNLPQVVMIEPSFANGNDEHPGIPNNIQVGVAATKKFIDALMSSSAWKDSVFILTFDEAGGIFDHVPPPTNVPSPDGIAPMDLQSDDPPGDFTRYGFRVPLIVVSPFAKKNFVSHTVTDYTSILRLIEARFSLSTLTKRDASVMDMTEFFDFKNPPFLIPPATPAQPTNGPCYNGLP